MTYTFEPYDVLQIKSRDGSQWLDFSTIRTKDDATFAQAAVDQQSFGGRPGEFRITRFAPGKGHVPFYTKQPAELSAPAPKLSEQQIDGLLFYREQQDRAGRSTREPRWQTYRSLVRLGLLEKLFDRDSRYVGTVLTPAGIGAIATYAPEAL